MKIINRTKKSIGYAIRGVKYIFKHEQNFRIEVFALIPLITVMIILPLSRAEIVLLSLLALFVLSLEIINSVLEKFIDVVKPRLSYQAEIMKDMLAAMVFLAAISSVIIGSFVIWDPLFELIAK